MNKSKYKQEGQRITFLNTLTFEFLKDVKETQDSNIKQIDESLTFELLKEKFYLNLAKDLQRIKESIMIKKGLCNKQINFFYVQKNQGFQKSDYINQCVDLIQKNMKNSLSYLVKIKKSLIQNSQKEQQISLKQDLFQSQDSQQNFDVLFNNFVHSISKRRQHTLFSLDITPIKYHQGDVRIDNSLQKCLDKCYSNQFNLSSSPQKYLLKYDRIKDINIFGNYKKQKKKTSDNQKLEESDQIYGQKNKKEHPQFPNEQQKQIDDISQMKFMSFEPQSARSSNKTQQQLEQPHENNQEHRRLSCNKNQESKQRRSSNIFEDNKWSSKEIYLKLKNEESKIEIKINNYDTIKGLNKLVNKINKCMEHTNQ